MGQRKGFQIQVARYGNTDNKESTQGRFSCFIQSESVTPWDVMQKLKEIELEVGTWKGME